MTSKHPDNLRNRVYCSVCGATSGRRNGLAPLGWQEMPNREQRSTALCAECVRRNLWLIEARLDFNPGTEL
ncbi:hypothetical protein BH18ACT15_BH18ACT15_13320 [soil metagenome]